LIAVNYGGNKRWGGYLTPEVISVPYTGYKEQFTINFVSSLDILKEKQFNEATNLFSIQDLLDKIKANTLLMGIVVNKSFSESLSDIKINSNNFTNDDTDNETYYTILEWICTTFGFK
jgi:hypothetical protein